MEYKIKNNIPRIAKLAIMVFLFAMIIPLQIYGEQKEVRQSGATTVKGFVTDSKKEPLMGVSVSIKGTTTGTFTNLDGDYSLEVPAGNHELVFSYIGFQKHEEKINNRTTIDIVMHDDSELLNEVVVVGYGVQKKINLTGSLSNVGADKIENRPTPNLSTSLAGLSPGVNVTQKSGNPGDENVDFTIRGVGSFNGTGPLVIIDGAEGSMNSVNQDDVENITILKDGASAAIYGARAANGVILITTKKGTKDEKPRVSYSNVFASQKAQTKWKLMSDMPTWMEWHNQAQINNNPYTSNLWYSQDLIDTWRNANANPNRTDNSFGIANKIAYPNTDWATELYKATFFQRHNLSVSGGSKNSTYLLSLGFQDNPGTFENTGQQRFNIRANVETIIADRVKFGTQTYGTKTKKDPGNTELAYRFITQAYPGMNPKIGDLYGASEDPNMSNMNNPLRNIVARGGKIEETTINTTWYANVDIWNGLSGEVRFNYQNIFLEERFYDKNVPLYRFRNGTTDPVEKIGSLADATTSRGTRKTEKYVLNFLLHYNKTFGDHDISGLLGYEQTEWNQSKFTASRKGLVDWNITDITSGANMYSIGGSAKENYAMLSYFGRVNYSYKSKYLFEANLRADGASQYAPGDRWGYFPSFSGGWRISEEDFYQPIKSIIEDAKIRVSWGKLGFIPTTSGYYGWQDLYGLTYGVLGQNTSIGLAQSQPGNPKLKWEKIATTDIGFDLYLLNRRMSVVFDYYNRKSSDILAQPDLPLSMGYIQSKQWLNTASMTNKGFEMSLGWNDKIDKVQYGVTFNVSYNSNKVTKYRGSLQYGEIQGQTGPLGNPVYGYTNIGSASTPYDSDRTRIVEGKMYKEFYLNEPYKGSGQYYGSDGKVDPNGGPRDGIIRTKADLEWARSMVAAGYSFNGQKVDMPSTDSKGNPTGGRGGYLWYGDQILADSNGDGIYGDSNDKKFTGKSAQPKWMLGIGFNAAWNGFDFSMMWDARIGSYAYINNVGVNGNISLEYDGINQNAGSLYYTYDAIQSVNDYANYDPATDPSANVNGRYPRMLLSTSTPANTLYLLNTSFLKLRSLQIGYTLPKDLIAKAGLSNVRVFVSGENLLTIKHKDFIGVDPELGSSINVYPLSRMFSGGINVTF